MNKHYPSMILDMLKTCFPQNEIKNADYFETPHQRIICLLLTNAKGQAEIVGVCFIRQIKNDTCFIHSVCVRKNRQRQKCCDRMFSYLVRSYGGYNLVLSVVKVGHQNKAAIKCYSKYGFLFAEDDTCTAQMDGLHCPMVRPRNKNDLTRKT
jgi:ribosomal protein S18 acetylase RimI-like enzyme